MLNKSVREAFISFTKENNSKYNNDIKDISHYRQQKEQQFHIPAGRGLLDSNAEGGDGQQLQAEQRRDHQDLLSLR